MTYCKNYCEEKCISTSELNEVQKTLYYIAENMKTDKSISEEGYTHFQQAIKALEQEPKILNTLDFAIDASNGETNYFVGFRNGLRYAKSLIDGEEEPPFESCTEPKTGHWIIDGHHRRCSECEEYFCNEDKENNAIPNHFCPNCGAKMIEQKESEDDI